MRTLANGSEENENDFRLFARRHRRCRLAVLLALRLAAARAILAPIACQLAKAGTVMFVVNLLRIDGHL
jgi:hypothetical protein